MKFDTQGWYLERGLWGELDGILIAPRDKDPGALVTLCHGFGAPGTDLVSLAEELVPALADDLRAPAFFFPEGPIDLEPIYGMPGARAWWPLNMAMLAELAAADAFSEIEDQVPEGIDSARDQLSMAISECLSRKGWGSLQHILGGFSQGSMLAVDMALRSRTIPASGVIIWSGALLCRSVWSSASNPQTRILPAYQSHGRQDTILPISAGRSLQRFLAGLGWDIESEEFDGPHTITMESISGATRLIERVVRSCS